MEKINSILESKSLSTYPSSYSMENGQIVVPKKQTKIFTDTKSRLILHFNADRIYKENARKVDAYRDNDQSPESSASALRTLQQRMVLERHQLMTKDKLPKESPSITYAKQARFRQGFDIDGFRRYSNQEVNAFVRKGSRTDQNYEKHWGSNEEELLNGTAFQRLKKAKWKLLTDEKSSLNENTSFTNVKRKLSFQNHSFTYQSGNVTALSKVKKEELRTRHNNDLLKQLNAGQWSSQMEMTSPNQILRLSDERSNLNVDIRSMKQCLQNSSSAIKKFDLLQSLVLIISNQELSERSATIQAIVDNDLFGIKCENGTGVLEDILWPVNITTPHPLQTSAAKLLNHLVSHEIGRDYFNGISMVKLLTCSSKEQIIDAMSDNLIDVMKKLSLNDFQRHDMLANGLLQWLIAHMEAVEFSASTFHMECMTDLLRVLMNVEESREESVNVPHLIIVLVRYLNVANEYAKLNVGHVLRALFHTEEAVEIGNKINLHLMIRDYIERESNSNLRTDLQSIYESLVKYRESNLSRIRMSAADGSWLSSPKKLSDDPHEQLICEIDLMRKSSGNKDESGQTTQLPEKPNSQNLPVELKSCILQLIRGEEFMETDEMERGAAVDEQNEQMLNRGADVLFSSLNSRLDQRSSLLSSGSHFAESKHNAIETLQMQTGSEMNSVGNKIITAIPTSTLQSKIMCDNTAVGTDYSELTLILKDPDARNEILENESFIEELCEKVFNRLKTKLAENFFCGTNCNTNIQTGSNNCCGGRGAKV